MKKVQKLMLLTSVCFLFLLGVKAEESICSNESKSAVTVKQSALYYRVFRVSGEFVGLVKVADPAELTQRIKKFGKGTYVCVGTGNTAIADRRIIVY